MTSDFPVQETSRILSFPRTREAAELNHALYAAAALILVMTVALAREPVATGAE